MLSTRLMTLLATALTVSACATTPSESQRAASELGAERSAATTSPRTPVLPPIYDASISGAAASAPATLTPSQSATAKAETAAPSMPAITPPQDIWERIRRGYGMQPVMDPRVEGEINWFAQRPDYIDRMAERGEPYLYYIVEEVERRGMPTELALLPVIESAFQPFAHSRARASGIWQFIPSTGQHYGLKQNFWYDGRRDVVASTQAALDYLQKLYNQFNDWELALAAYNAGEGTVQRAIDKNLRRGKPASFWSLDLPAETRSYVPRLLAVRAVIEDPARYSLALKSIPNKPYIEVVKVDGQIDLALAAELAQLPVDEVYRLNPGINRWATDPNGPHDLVLPVDKVEPFKAALAALPAERRLRWESHRVTRGESLSSIARHYHTTPQVIAKVNGLERGRVRPGQYLAVPVAARLANRFEASLLPAAATAAVEAASQRKRIHKVRAGDSLWAIARRYNVSTTDLMKWNHLKSKSRLRAGTSLVIWTEVPVKVETRVARGNDDQGQVKLASVKKPSNVDRPASYTVRRGDTLYDIARKFNVGVDDLRRWNKLDKKGYLRPGQRLLVEANRERDKEEQI